MSPDWLIPLTLNERKHFWLQRNWTQPPNKIEISSKRSSCSSALGSRHESSCDLNDAETLDIIRRNVRWNLAWEGEVTTTGTESVGDLIEYKFFSSTN